MKLFWLTISCITLVRSTVMTLSGGEITISGTITNNYLDLRIDFTANVQWVAIIWSQNEADTDVTLFKANPSNPSAQVTLVDCYLNQNSAIVTDNIPNLMPSITGFTGSLSNGISASFKRDLNTGDLQDVTLYQNSVIQICFISSIQAFKGNGYETGNEKNCGYVSLHSNVVSSYDRMLGNYAGTSTFGGGNLTVYATDSTDGGTFDSWLFLTVVHKAQGSNGFKPRWLGVLYSNSMSNNDLAIIQYTTKGVSLDLYTNDFFIVNSTFADYDSLFVTGQGSEDLSKVLSAYDSSSYVVGSYKRKFSTGDNNRDIILSDGNNTFCVFYGNDLVFSTFSSAQQYCFNFNLGTVYSSFFRQTSSTSVNVQNYVAPANKVLVVTVS